MVAMRELLERLRPAGAPGAATVAGVPVDRRHSAEVEVAPVFDALAGVVVECERRRRAAGEDAAHVVADAEQRAQAVTARARAGVEAERAAAASVLWEASAIELGALSQRAGIEAERVRRDATGRNDALVKHVVDLARSHLLTLSTADVEPAQEHRS
jgi:hypothetical protein